MECEDVMRKLKIILLLIMFLILPFMFAEDSTSVIVPLATNGVEGELVIPTPVVYPETELEESQDTINFFTSVENNSGFSLNTDLIYKSLNIPYYFLKENQNLKKRIYVFNQGRTYVINNSPQETTKDKTIELNLNLSDNTQAIYLVIDNSQSSQIPEKNRFVNTTSSTIEINTLPRYLKINKSNIKNNKLFFNLKANISNFSLQIIESDNEQYVNGVYSTNILQLDYDSFNKYALFQINKNIIEFYCPYCYLKDFGINENGFSSCGKSVFEEKKKPITEYLSANDNVCLYPDGSRISGFTNESLKVFGIDRLYFGWDDKISSDLFDYGEYYIDQDQFRIAVSKKIDAITNNNYVQIGNIKYKKGKNNLISKVGTYIEHDLSQITEISPNNSISESLAFSIAVLDSVPEEYKKLTILDLTNNEPDVSDYEFDKLLHEILGYDNYKYTDYHTHHQITLEKYLFSIDNFKKSRVDNDIYSKLLYGLEYKTQGYSNIYYSEGLNYFIYNIKPFTEETTKILNNEHTQMFGRNYWKLELTDLDRTTDPITVVVNVSEIIPESKNAKINLNNPTTNLHVNYYFENQYFASNPLFLKTINALSYNRGNLFENTTSFTSKVPEVIENYNNLQDGRVVSFDTLHPDFIVNLTEPVIITKDKGEQITIKYFNGKEYVNYTNDLIIINNSREEDDFATKETIVIYPPKLGNINHPMIIESFDNLIFNVDVLENIENGKHVYRLKKENQNIRFSELINDIYDGKACFSISSNQFAIWKNIDEELDIAKVVNYQEFASLLENSEELLEDQFAQSVPNQNSQPDTTYAVYTTNDYQTQYKNIQAVNKFIITETDNRNLNVLKDYSIVYEELIKNEPTLKKEFSDLLNCNETLICKISKTKYVPNKSFFERYKNVCVSNTPTECVSFWSNPKVNYCSAFVRNFNKNFYGYNFDSANAWDLAKQKNNISIWKATTGSLQEKDYDLLIPGSVLGIKHNNTNYKDKEYSHVVVYLGKIGSKHYIIHSWVNTLKIEQLDVFLKTTARGKNSYGFYENGQIKEVMISNNLNQKLIAKARENGISLGFVDSSIFEGKIPDYIFDSYNMLLTNVDDPITNPVYKELEEVYNRILQKEFNIYYKNNYSKDENPEINEKIRLDPKEPMIVILGKYKKLFLVNKDNNKTNIIEEFPLSTGINGFGCGNDSSKTPIGLFKIVQKVGRDCLPFQIIDANGSKYDDDGLPVFSTKNAGTAYVVTRKLVIDGLEKGNIGINCENGNRNTIYRGIYIHGTNREDSMGKQRSHGCIRMLNDDVITLFDLVKNGTYVYVYNTETSYSSLLENINQFAASDGYDGVMWLEIFARRPPNPHKNSTSKSTVNVVKKTMTDVNKYIDYRISLLRMFSTNNVVNLKYAKKCNSVNLKLPCFIKTALDVEYLHVTKPQSSEFNEIVFTVTKAFGFSFEEIAQFWGNMAQESGTNIDLNGSNSSPYGIAQIKKSSWSKYEDNKYTMDAMVADFKDVDLSSIIKEDNRIRSVTSITGNKNTIDSREEIIALLKLVWSNNSRYASVVFAAGLTRYLGRKTITESQNKQKSDNKIEPFSEEQRIKYDHNNSINFFASYAYKYMYTSAWLMYSGIKEYSVSELSGTHETFKAIVLKLANYLAFKKEYYMYFYGLVELNHSDMLYTLNKVYGGEFPKRSPDIKK